MKYWPSSRGFNKLVIKAEMHANTYFLKFSLLYKNTNPVLKYPVFIKKKNCFMQMAKSLKAKNHIVVSYNKENFKKICFSMHFGFNNQFIKVTRTRLIFQNF